jgi:NAD(P)-dependent dehydrogenase (short-subunit alcohol dehydrogenase family)
VLQGRIAVITGAAAGIGQATALLFAREGARLVCVDEKPGDETLALLRGEGLDASWYCTDVSDSGEVQEVARACAEHLPRVDILFNNAGRVERKAFEATSEAVWHEMIAVNLTSEFLCSRYFLPLIKKSTAGSIINHASIDAFLGNPAIAAYSAAKGGLVPLTHVMAHDLGKYNIRVNCLCSGGIPVPRKAAATKPGAIAGQSRIDVTPLQRAGTPEEVAYAALFLASRWSSFVNGASLVVDGGRTAITQGTYHGYD